MIARLNRIYEHRETSGEANREGWVMAAVFASPFIAIGLGMLLEQLKHFF